MDQAEINRRIVGLLTLAYREEWDPEAGADIQTLGAAVSSLVEQIGFSEIDLEISSDEFDGASELPRSLMMQGSRDIPLLIAGFLEIFTALCHEISEAHPDFDIDKFLQQKGLEAAGEG